MNAADKHRSLNPVKVLLTLGIIGGLGVASSDLYVSSLPSFLDVFDVSLFAMNLTLAIYFLATAFGCISFIYLSQHYSHTHIHTLSFAVFIGGGLVIAFNSEYTYIFLGRLLQGAGYGLIQANIMAYMKKNYQNNFGRSLSLCAFASESFCIFAPLLGTLLVSFINWNAPFLFISCLSFGLYYLSKDYLRDAPMAASQSIWADIGKLRRNKTFLLYNLLSFMFIGLGWGMVTLSPYCLGTEQNCSLIHSIFYGSYSLLYALGCFIIERGWVKQVFSFASVLISLCLMLLIGGFTQGSLPVLGAGLLIFGFLSGLLYGPILEKATSTCAATLANSASTFLVLFRLMGSGTYIVSSSYLYSLNPAWAYGFFIGSLCIAAMLIYQGHRSILRNRAIQNLIGHMPIDMKK